MSTIWQTNAAAFASTPETYVAQERRIAVRRALALIVDHKPGKALYVLVRSVERQARIAGAGHIEIHPGCPCPGRCDHGTEVAR